MSATHYQRVRGLSLAYAEAGAGAPLVCVHGNFASRRWFTSFLQNPPAGYRVIAPDLPNFGRSDAMPEAISIQVYAAYLKGFCDALSLAPLTLLGHSLGGAVAQVFAANYPDTLAKLILVSAPGPSGLKTPEERYPLLEMLKDNRQLMAQALAPTMSQAERPAYFEDLVDDALAMQAAGYSGNARALEHYDVRRKLTRVDCPVLVIHCEKDYLVSEKVARSSARAFENTRFLRLEGLGHSPQIEAPERFLAALQTFLVT